MGDFRRYLLVADHNDHRTEESREIDFVSWDSVSSIGNAADYDAWILIVTALMKRTSPKTFTVTELQTLFTQRVVVSVLAGGGSIFVIGDFKSAFFTPASVGSGSRGALKADELGKGQLFDPLGKIVDIQRDARPVDYRRTERPHDYDYPKIYAYLDKVTRFDYSLKTKVGDGGTSKIPLATTNFGTCLALCVHVGEGRLFFMPSLGTTVEAEVDYVLDKIFGFSGRAEAPAWAKVLKVPGQDGLERGIADIREEANQLIEKLKAQNKQLVEMQRWKRLLFEDGFGLEEIVKQSFELLGAKVVKKAPEKDDYRLEVSGYGPCVLEVKGTRKNQFPRTGLRQLSEWMDLATSEELIAVKGAFVGNAARETDPSTREALTDNNNLAYAKLKQMVLFRTVDLYVVVVLALLEKLDKDNFWKRFFNCSGEFEASDYWKVLPTEFALTGPETREATQ